MESKKVFFMAHMISEDDKFFHEMETNIWANMIINIRIIDASKKYPRHFFVGKTPGM